MAIQNGKERIENLRNAMHREIDKMVDDIIANGNVQKFNIAFGCGYDELLTMDLRFENTVKDANGCAITLAEIAVIESEGE